MKIRAIGILTIIAVVSCGGTTMVSGNQGYIIGTDFVDGVCSIGKDESGTGVYITAYSQKFSKGVLTQHIHIKKGKDGIVKKDVSYWLEIEEGLDLPTMSGPDIFYIKCKDAAKKPAQENQKTVL